MTFPGNVVWSFGCALLVACGGGGGGGSAPLAGPLPSVPDDTVSDGSDNPNGSPSVLASLSNLEQFAFTYRLGTQLDLIAVPVARDIRGETIFVPSTDGEYIAQCDSGNRSLRYGDNNNDGSLGNRDTMHFQFDACKVGDVTFSGTWDITRVSDWQFDTQVTLTTDAGIALKSVGFRMNVDTIRGQWVTLQTLEIKLFESGGEVSWNGVPAFLRWAIVRSSTLGVSPGRHSLDIDFGLDDLGATPLFGMRQLSADSSEELIFPDGSAKPESGVMSVQSLPRLGATVKYGIDADPAYLRVTDDPSIMTAGDETVSRVPWSDVP